MKLNKKKVFALALAVCLLAILSVGSLAWFSASDSVKNDFLIADSQHGTEDAIFSVDVWEKSPDSAEDTDGYEYADILPNAMLVKEPHVENTGYYDQYVRVIVTFSDVKAWKAVIGENADLLSTLCAGYDAAMWTDITTIPDQTADTLTYVLYYDGILESGKDITVFTHFHVPASMTQKQAEAFAGGFTVDVKAQAVQTEHVGDNAFEAFQTVNMPIQ